MKKTVKKTKYLQVREAVLAESMASGIDAIPSERTLAEKYGVSRITAKKALDSMAEDKLVTRHVGQGTFLIREKAKTKVRLYLASTPTELPPFFKEAARLFTKKHPEIDIEICVIPTHDLTTSLAIYPGAKIVCLPNINYLAELNIISPLQELEGYEQVMHKISSQYIDQWNGNTYSLPLFLMPEMIGFNRSLVRELGLDDTKGPQDWAEMLTWAKAMNGHPLTRGNGASTFISKGSSIMPVSFYLTASRGRHYIDEQCGSAKLSFDYGEQWLQFFQTLHNIESVKPMTDFRFSPLLQGESLFSFKIGPWIIKQAEQCKGMDNIGLSLIPPTEKNQPSFCEVLKWNLALVRNDQITEKEQDAAWSFLKYLSMDDECQRLLISQFSAISVNRHIYEEQQGDASWYPFFQALATGRLCCDHPIQNVINRILHKYYEAAVFNNMDVNKAAESFVSSAKTLFELHQEYCPELMVQFL